MRSGSHGFSLLEISVVLVVISLITGGVMLGRDMIRQAELRTILSDSKEYATAVSVFQLRFRAMPGDFKTATNIWGAADPVDATCWTTIGVGKTTCNGDGDNRISNGGSDHHERFRFWQHLVNAELIKGHYTGVSGGSGSYPSQEPLIGINCPKGSVPGAGFYANQLVIGTGNINWFQGNYGNYFEFGSYGENGLRGDRVLSGKEAGVLDQKADDGLPHRGRIVTSPNTRALTPNCADGPNGGTTYDTASDERDCPLYILYERML